MALQSGVVLLASGVSARWLWAKGTDHTRGVPFGALIAHGDCPPLVVMWAAPTGEVDEEDLWTLESLDPLTVSPAVRCGSCRREAQIVDGRWQAL